MDKILSLKMPEAMISSIENLSRTKNCSTNTVIKLAVAKFLFDQTLSEPEVLETKNESRAPHESIGDISKQLPLDRIISVQYTLDDGRVIHIMRQSKLRGVSSSGGGSS